jgi:hypothetical protein
MPFTAEQQAEIDALIETATTGLKNKNTELLTELKKARKSAEITPEQMAEVEAERDKAQTELQAAHKAAKDAAKAYEVAVKALEQESGFTQKLLVDNGLVSELTKHGVTNAVSLKAAQSMLRGGVKVEVDGENRVAKYGDKALSDYVKEWAASDEGKHFVTAPSNSGGGAQGSGGSKTEGMTMTRASFDGLDIGKKVEFSKKGGKLTDQ